MKYIKVNKDKLKIEEITKEVTRIKVLLINSKEEILLGYSYHCYQFIGGHLEVGESLTDCLKREVLEEVGIKLKIKNIEPFLFKEEYYRNYPTMGENYNSKIYYFLIKTDMRPNFSRTKYTEDEQKGNFHYQYVPLINFENTIIENYQKYEEAKVIGLEMLTAYREYLKLKL